MNITFFSSVSTKEKVFAQIPEFRNHNTRYFKLDERDKLLFQAKDTELLFIDAMGVFNKEMIDSMPNLKLIMSEGVGYQGVDVEYANEKGIPVCNNKGVNDTAVSEVALCVIFQRVLMKFMQGGKLNLKKRHSARAGSLAGVPSVYWDLAILHAKQRSIAMHSVQKLFIQTAQGIRNLKRNIMLNI